MNGLSSRTDRRSLASSPAQKGLFQDDLGFWRNDRRLGYSDGTKYERGRGSSLARFVGLEH
jgi:hypothetical protein